MPFYLNISVFNCLPSRMGEVCALIPDGNGLCQFLPNPPGEHTPPPPLHAAVGAPAAAGRRTGA